MSKRRRRTEDLTVQVDVEPHKESGHFNYTHAVLHTHKGDKVQWKSSTGPFVIQFQKGTPFKRVHCYSLEKSGAHWIDLSTVDSLVSGRYPYAVAMYVDTEKRVYIDAGCPEIIIED